MSEAKGHAVRATYFYTAMTDIALHQSDAAYQQAVDRIWTNAIHKKHYLTGGVGASHKGEAFAGDYELSNDGYCESCASCGLIFWADRQHRLHADGHFRDVQERALYNNVLGSVELSGTKFYYQNPLDEKRARYPWHKCPCCVGKADSRIAANVGRVALQYGPLVYNVESVDLPSGKNLDTLALAPDPPLRAEWDETLLGGVLAIRGAFSDGTPLQAIPNYARMNRPQQHKSKWIHLANTYDGTTQSVYVNGRLAKSRQPGPLNVADTPLTIGSDPFGQKRHFKGTFAKPAVFNAALDIQTIAQLAAANPDTPSLGVDIKPVFAGGNYTLDGTTPVVTPKNIGISGNAPWTMSVWVKPDADDGSADNFSAGIVGWGKPDHNAGNFLYYRTEGEAVFGFYGNDDRAPIDKTAAGQSVVWLQEQK